MGAKFDELVRQRDAAKADGNMVRYDRLARFVKEIEDGAARSRRAKRLGVRPIDVTEFGPGGAVLPFIGGTYDT